MTQTIHHPLDAKARVNFYIDGLNVYHRIRDYLQKTSIDYRWLDYRSLCEKVLRPGETVGEIYFFTSINNKIPPPSIGRHRRFISAMRARKVNVVEGYFSKSGQEKQTDVNITVRMLTDAVRRQCGKCILLSADNDFVSALQAVSDLSEGEVKTVLMTPPYPKVSKRDTRGSTKQVGKLKEVVDGVIEMTFDSFKGHSLPSEIKTADGSIILKPDEYQIF